MARWKLVTLIEIQIYSNINRQGQTEPDLSGYAASKSNTGLSQYNLFHIQFYFFVLQTFLH